MCNSHSSPVEYHSCILTSLSDIKIAGVKQAANQFDCVVPSAAVGTVVYPTQSNSLLQCKPWFTLLHNYTTTNIIFTILQLLEMLICKNAIQGSCTLSLLMYILLFKLKAMLNISYPKDVLREEAKFAMEAITSY